MADAIKILLVDDIPDVRENVKKLLAFEQDFEVVGSTGSGHDGIKLAREQQPDIIIMDINMPDIDGISATQEIKRFLPSVGVIMMSVNSDRDYMRRAMTAGASDFLTKPANMDDLYNTIRSVYKVMEPMRMAQQRIATGAYMTAPQETKKEGDRAGNVIVCYSPKGGVGTTTIATNLASGLMQENIKVLLVDGDVQFGDVGVFLNIKAQSTIVDLIMEDLDIELFENVVVTHGSGLKILLGPTRPEFADQIYETPRAVADVIEAIRHHYDFVIIDTSCRLDEVTISLCDIATHILLISTPTLPSIRSTRFVLDLFDQLYENPNKVKLVLTQVHDEKRGQRITIPQESIVNHLKREVYGAIPANERPILQAIIKGIPVIAAERETNQSPTKELLELANKLRSDLMGANGNSAPAEEDKPSGGFKLFGR